MNDTVEIFTTGDPYLIETVLTAVMMALDAGGMGAGNAIGGAMAIGILVAAINALVSNEWNFNKLIAAFVIWFAMFGFSMGGAGGTRYDAVITGPNGSTAFVSDLPLGIAMPYYVLGIVGPELNDVLSTAFSLPMVIPAGDGTAESVKVPSDPYVALMNLRSWQPTRQSTVHPTRSNADTHDLELSLLNYVEDCVSAYHASQGRSVNIENMSQFGFFNDLDVPQIPFTTDLYFELSSATQAINSGDAPHNETRPATVHCDIAHDELSAYMDSNWVDAATVDLNIFSRVNVDSAINLVQATYDGSANAADLVRSEFARYIVRRAAVEGERDFSALDLSMEKARFRAMQDKNTKGSADYAYFNENWTIMLQIFEIITYFATIIIPFIILISGGALLKIVTAWLTLVVWVNTIPITAVLSKLFVEYYSSLVATCTNPTSPECLNLQSVGGIESSYTTIETALGMGGTIAQLMPTVTLFLLTGSAYALMGAANSAPKASTDTSNINPKFGGTVSGDGSNITGREFSGQLGAVDGASFTVNNANNTSPTIKMDRAYQTAASNAIQAGNTASREVGGTSQSAIQTLRSTSNNSAEMKQYSSEKQQQIQDALRLTDQTATNLQRSAGEQSTDMEKASSQIAASLTAFAGAKGQWGTPGILNSLFGAEGTVYGGVEGRLSSNYSSEDVSQFLQSLGVEQSIADQLSKSEEFVSTLGESAREALTKQDTLSILNDVSQNDMESLAEAYKATESYQQIQAITNNASSGRGSSVELNADDFITGRAQEDKALNGIRDTGLLSQNEQLGLLTKGMNNETRDNVITGFQAYSAERDFSNASYSERQKILNDYIDEQKRAGVNFSSGERALGAEVASINRDFTNLRETMPDDTRAVQSFLLDKLGNAGNFELGGNLNQDRQTLAKFDDNVDTLSEFMVSPEKMDYLRNYSQDLLDVVNKGGEVTGQGSRTLSDVVENANLEGDNGGRLQFKGNREEAFDKQYDEESDAVRASSEANGVGDRVQSIEELQEQAEKRSGAYNERLEQSRALLNSLDEFNRTGNEVAPYEINTEGSYNEQTREYLNNLPINDNLRNDTSALFDAMKTANFNERLNNGFDLMSQGTSAKDLNAVDARDLRLAQAYVATQNNDSLRDFSNVAEQLLKIDGEQSGLSRAERLSVEDNLQYFNREGVLPQSISNASNQDVEGRYRTDINDAKDYIGRVAEEYGLKFYTPASTGPGRGFAPNMPTMGEKTLESIANGDLKSAFDNLSQAGVNNDGREKQLLEIAAADFIKYGSESQQELGSKINSVISSYENSGGDYQRFVSDYKSRQSADYGTGPRIEEYPDSSNAFSLSDITGNSNSIETKGLVESLGTSGETNEIVSDYKSRQSADYGTGPRIEEYPDSSNAFSLSDITGNSNSIETKGLVESLGTSGETNEIVNNYESDQTKEYNTVATTERNSEGNKGFGFGETEKISGTKEPQNPAEQPEPVTGINIDMPTESEVDGKAYSGGNDRVGKG